MTVLFTPAGRFILALAVSTTAAGALLGWTELWVTGGAGLCSLLLAVPFVIGRSRVGLSRTLIPDRGMVGETATLQINIDRTPAGRQRCINFSSAETIELSIPVGPKPYDVSIDPGEDEPTLIPIDTTRRGVVTIGPATVSRTDPLGLMARNLAELPAERYLVHPQHRPVRTLAAGFAKDLEGPTYDTSPAGDVTFHALRPYQVGDDVRLVHWMSSARAGDLLIRQYVDTRLPHIGVLIDDSIDALSASEFESAIEIGASIANSALDQDQSVVLRVGDVTVVGESAPGTSDDVLDRLCVVEQGDRDLTLFDLVTDTLVDERAVSAIVVAIGSTEPDDLIASIELAQTRCRTVVVQLGAPAAPFSHPGTRVLQVNALDDFVDAWEMLR